MWRVPVDAGNGVDIRVANPFEQMIEGRKYAVRTAPVAPQ